jgi:hypothetical protein
VGKLVRLTRSAVTEQDLLGLDSSSWRFPLGREQKLAAA